MIQKGIVESIISSYEYKVRIPRYDKLATTPGGVSTGDLSSAIVCSTPGTKIVYTVGDIVLVGFENEELNRPVILGALYKADNGNPEQFVSPIVEKALAGYKQDIDKLKSTNLYTHVKYSNDNGLTFTSLYDYTDVIINTINQTSYKEASNISIDPTSTIIYWSIVNSDGVDITSSINIETTIYNDDLNISESFTDSLIKIPVKFQGLNNLKLSFRIVSNNSEDYHIVLTTDKNTIGSIYGDYIGICVTTESTAPNTIGSYTWMSLYDSIFHLVSKLEDSLLPRVERNEKTLYGYTYSSDIRTSDSTGLLDGIKVEKNLIDIHGSENKDIYFNSSKSMFIDNSTNNFTTQNLKYSKIDTENSFIQMYTNDNHLTLVRKNS